LLDGSGTISWNDFGLLADIPCRKLALLDTCHSGAIQGFARIKSWPSASFKRMSFSSGCGGR